jgi:hypothetical protein
MGGQSMNMMDYTITKSEYEYATIKTDIKEVRLTFWALKKDYETEKAKYLKEVSIKYNQHKFLEAFKTQYIKSTIDAVFMVEVAIHRNIRIVYLYDLMGAFEVIRLNKKTVTVLDCTNRKCYISHKEFNKLEKGQFRCSMKENIS